MSSAVVAEFPPRLGKSPEAFRTISEVATELDVPQRRTNYAEVLLGLAPESALAESSRCLRCDVRDAGAAKR